MQSLLYILLSVPPRILEKLIPLHAKELHTVTGEVAMQAINDVQIG